MFFEQFDLQMVAETAGFWRRLRLGKAIFCKWSCGGVNRFLRFSRKRQNKSIEAENLHQIFSCFCRKHLFITTFCGKRYVRPLSFNN